MPVDLSPSNAVTKGKNVKDKKPSMFMKKKKKPMMDGKSRLAAIFGNMGK